MSALGQQKVLTSRGIVGQVKLLLGKHLKHAWVEGDGLLLQGQKG